MSLEKRFPQKRAYITGAASGLGLAIARRLANLVQASWVPNEIGAATHYHATYVQPGWAERMDRIALVGDHIFYREEPRQYRH